MRERPRDLEHDRAKRSDFDRFKDLTRRLVAVPKKELNHQATKAQKAKKKS